MWEKTARLMTQWQRWNLVGENLKVIRFLKVFSEFWHSFIIVFFRLTHDFSIQITKNHKAEGGLTFSSYNNINIKNLFPSAVFPYFTQLCINHQIVKPKNLNVWYPRRMKTLMVNGNAPYRQNVLENVKILRELTILSH